MASEIDTYIRERAKECGLSISALCKRADISRQTFYELAEVPAKLPSLNTLIALAWHLEVHPMRLLQKVFVDCPIRKRGSASELGDHSAFVRDVTIPDGSPVLPGQRFVKTWELQNVGSVPWENRYLICQDEELVVMGWNGEALEFAEGLQADANRVPLPRTQPGETVKVSVTFTAPKLPGTVLSYWKLANADGSLCFPEATGVWVKVNVVALSGAQQCEAVPAG